MIRRIGRNQLPFRRVEPDVQSSHILVQAEHAFNFEDLSVDANEFTEINPHSAILSFQSVDAAAEQKICLESRKFLVFFTEKVVFNGYWSGDVCSLNPSVNFLSEHDNTEIFKICKMLLRSTTRHAVDLGYQLQNISRDAIAPGQPLDLHFPSSFLEYVGKCSNFLPNQCTIYKTPPKKATPFCKEDDRLFKNGISFLPLGQPALFNFLINSPDTCQSFQLQPNALLVVNGRERFEWVWSLRKSKLSGGVVLVFRELVADCVALSATVSIFPALASPENEDSICRRADVWEEGKEAEFEREYVGKVYQQIASHFSHTRYKPWPFLYTFLLSLPVGSLVVDAGCGNGKYARSIPGSLAVGLDNCREFLDIIQNRRDDGGRVLTESDESAVEVVRADCLAIPMRSEVADVAISVAVLHHLCTPQRREAALRELLRVVRPGGRAVCTVWAMEQGECVGARKFEAQDVLVPWGDRSASSGQIKRYYHAFTESEFLEFCQVEGAEVERIEFETNNWICVFRKLE